MNSSRYGRWLFTALLLGVLSAWFSARLGASETPNRDAFIASLAGGWAGDDNLTPLGPMPFTILFDWEEDGSLHSHSALNRETYIDLRLVRSASGDWILHEEAAMEGLGTQAYSLSPTTGPAGLYRWSYQEEPEFLVVDLSVKDDVMSMIVALRGEEHASFTMQRLPKEALGELREQLALQARQSPSEGRSIKDVVGRSASRQDTDPIAMARSAVAALPRDGAVHLELARVLGQAIRQDTAMNGPRYSAEMLQALQTAIELEPGLEEAYQWLVGYYMNAPAIAGGSIDKAVETARRLEGFNPAGGQALLAQIEAGRNGSE